MDDSETLAKNRKKHDKERSMPKAKKKVTNILEWRLNVMFFDMKFVDMQMCQCICHAFYILEWNPFCRL